MGEKEAAGATLHIAVKFIDQQSRGASEHLRSNDHTADFEFDGNTASARSYQDPKVAGEVRAEGQGRPL
jgi:hypothetical protein